MSLAAASGSAGDGVHFHRVQPNGSAWHDHPTDFESPAVSDGTNLPSYKEINFCRADTVNCPQPGLVALFAGQCPNTWVEHTSYRGYYLRGEDGNGTWGEIGGAPFHSHTIAGHSATASLNYGHTHQFAVGYYPHLSVPLVFGGTVPRPYSPFGHKHGGSMSHGGGHSHTVATGTDFDSGMTNNEPAWRELVVCELL